MKKKSNIQEPQSLRHAWRLHRKGATIYGETTIGTLRFENGEIRALSPNAGLIVSFESTFSDHYKQHFFLRLRQSSYMLAIF